MENKYCVYKHTTPSGKVYIGITGKKPEIRWGNGKGYIHNKHFTNAINKYGWKNIRHEILIDGLNAEQASEFERLYIYMHHSDDSRYGYNKTTGGEKGFKIQGENKVRFDAIMRSSDRRKRVSDGVKKYYEDPEARKKASEIQIKKWQKPEYREAQRKRMLIISNDPAVKKKQSDARKKRWEDAEYRASMCGGNNPIATRIEQYSLDGEYIKTFDCIMDAIRELGYGNHANITACAKGRCHKVYGYIWIYEDEENKDALIHKKVNASMKGKNHPRAKAVEQYDFDGNFIRRFDTVTEAAEYYGISSGNIGSCLKRRRKTTYNSIWKYADTHNEDIHGKKGVIWT